MATDVSRRVVLIGAGAAALALTTPVELAAKALTENPTALGWWGYSLNGEVWVGPFESRENAYAEGIQYLFGDPDDRLHTARCVSQQLGVPDLHEDVINWLAEHHPHRTLRHCLFDAFEGYNSDIDFDGEVGEALSDADWTWLVSATLNATAAALIRIERSDVAEELYQDGVVPELSNENALQALEADTRLRAELQAAGETWVLDQVLACVPRVLSLSAEKVHTKIAEGTDEATRLAP